MATAHERDDGAPPLNAAGSTVEVLQEGAHAVALDSEALHALLLSVLQSHGARGALCCILTGDAAIAQLNREYRQKDAPTDVLSFDLRDQVHPGDAQIGDIYISLDRARHQAAEGGLALQEEVSRLAVHGALHLLGFDHGTNAERRRMQRAESLHFPNGVAQQQNPPGAT